MNQATAG